MPARLAVVIGLVILHAALAALAVCCFRVARLAVGRRRDTCAGSAD